ncbi:MAG: FAD-dependent oxidoreductase [Gemmatimonadota bacterium]
MRPPAPRVLRGWGMANWARSLVYRPLDGGELAEAMMDARTRGLTLTARGSGLSYGDAALNQGGAVLDVSGMDRVLDFDPQAGLVRAEAGTTIEALWKHVLPGGWWPPVVPGTMKATLGGCVAMNVHGKNHATAGAVGRHVQALTLVTGEGEVRTLTRGVVPEDDAGLWGMSLADVIGAQGLTGTIVDVTLSLRRVHSGYLDVEVEATRSLPETFEALDRGAREADYTVAWVDCTGMRAGRGVLHHAWYVPPDHALAGRALDPAAQRLPSRVAGVLPRRQAWRALRPFTNRYGIHLLNFGRFHASALRGKRRYAQTHAAFHFLLDYVPDWKRAYGPHGLMQYQLFIPAAGAREAFADALHQQKKLGVPSYLGVMKRHTPEDAAASYSVDGYSLALDFPVLRGEGYSRLMRLCRALDRIVEDHGGRIYAAKDAVSLGELPERRDPAFSSNLVRRWERGLS